MQSARLLFFEHCDKEDNLEDMDQHTKLNHLARQCYKKNLSVRSSLNGHDQIENTDISSQTMHYIRPRARFNREDVKILECTFKQSRYPTADIIDDLSQLLESPQQKITIWFRNRRARFKKLQEEFGDQYSSDDENNGLLEYDAGVDLNNDIASASSASSPNSSPCYMPSSSSSVSASSSCRQETQTFSYASKKLVDNNSSDTSSSSVFQNVSNCQQRRDSDDDELLIKE